MNERTFRLGRRLAAAPESFFPGPDWAQASPARIRSALEHVALLPSGGWYAVEATRRLGREKHGAWRPLKVYDDGVLTWVRLDVLHEGEPLSERPFLAPRPRDFVEGTIRVEARCEPDDVIANRLDPWHGAHFHPKVFTNLRVTDVTDALLKLRVEYRVAGRVTVEVDATFHCPDPRTIVMTIVDGEGVGSVVETHATPIMRGRTAILETTLASSDRFGFRLARRFQRGLRPFMEYVARELWQDDAAYAERTYALRTGAISSSIEIDLPSDRDGRARERDSRPRLI
jgi:hypothetical protein